VDGWLCGECKSLNTPRAKSCYHCKVPRQLGESAQDPESTVIVRTNPLAVSASPPRLQFDPLFGSAEEPEPDRGRSGVGAADAAGRAPGAVAAASSWPTEVVAGSSQGRGRMLSRVRQAMRRGPAVGMAGDGDDEPRAPQDAAEDGTFAAALRATAGAETAARIALLGRTETATPSVFPTPPGMPRTDDQPVLRPVQRPPGPSSAPTPASTRATASPQPKTGAGGARPAVVTYPGSSLAPARDDTVGTPRRRRAAVSRRALVVALVAVVAIAAGAMIAAPRSGAPQDRGAATTQGLLSPSPAPTPLHSVVAATSAPTLSPSPEPTTPAWIAAVDLLATSTFAEDWVGRFDVTATLQVGDHAPVTWALAVARAGTTQWSRNRLESAATGVVTEETVILPRTVWERTGGTDWTKRDRSFGDQPMAPLFGIRQADDLTWVRTFKQSGRRLHEFDAPGADDLMALGFLRQIGASSLVRTGATVVADDAGQPVSATLTYAGSTRAGKAKLTIEVAYRDVAGGFEIGSPKDGPPVIAAKPTTAP